MLLRLQGSMRVGPPSRNRTRGMVPLFVVYVSNRHWVESLPSNCLGNCLEDSLILLYDVLDLAFQCGELWLVRTVPAARTIASSPLVKAAIYGYDPNWGRIVAALGRSGARVCEDRSDVYLNDVCAMKQRCPTPVSKTNVISALSNSSNVHTRLCLNSGCALVHRLQDLDGRQGSWPGCF